MVTKIRNYKCPNCNGNYTNYDCDCCGSKNEELEKDLNELEKILNAFKLNTKKTDFNRINKIFNCLMTIENTQDKVKNFLNQYNYQKNFYEYIKETLLRINKNEPLSNLDINTIETIIFQKNTNYELNKLHKYFITQCLQKKQNVSLECFQEIIKQIVETTLKPYYKENIQCIIKNYEPKDNYIEFGGNKAYKISLNSEEIKKLYNNQDPNILKVLFHKCTHGIQSKKVFNDNQEIDPLKLLEIKDKILSYNNPDYYEENYNNISFEIEAEFYGQLLASKYIEKNLLTPEIQQKYYNILNQTRTQNGQITDIDTLFNNEILNKPNILQKYPQLKHLYKLDNNQVKPLNEEELYNKYQELISDENITDKQKKKYELLYSQYIDITNQNKSI